MVEPFHIQLLSIRNSSAHDFQVVIFHKMSEDGQRQRAVCIGPEDLKAEAESAGIAWESYNTASRLWPLFKLLHESRLNNEPVRVAAALEQTAPKTSTGKKAGRPVEREQTISRLLDNLSRPKTSTYARAWLRCMFSTIDNEAEDAILACRGTIEVGVFDSCESFPEAEWEDVVSEPALGPPSDIALTGLRQLMQSELDVSPVSRLFGRNFSLRDIVVNVNVSPELTSGPDTLLQATQERRGRWLLLGPAGSGKTTLFRYACLRMLDGLEGKIPLFVRAQELNAFSRKQDFSESFSEQWQLTTREEEALRNVVEEGNAVLFIDGFDEVIERQRVKRVIGRLSSELGDCGIIVSSREMGQPTLSSQFSVLRLRSLGRREQVELLRPWLDRVGDSEAVVRALHRRKRRLARIARNPLLLTLVAIVVNEGHQLPRSRTQLYEIAVDILLKRAHSPESSRTLGSPAVASEILSHIAYRLHSEPDPWPASNVYRALEDHSYYQKLISSQFDSVELFLNEVAECSGLLQPVRNGYLFPHRAFREYFAACKLKSTVVGARIGEVPERPLASLFRKRVPDKHHPLTTILWMEQENPGLWTEVLALTCGMLPAEKKLEFLRRIAAQANRTVFYRVLAETDFVPAGLVLDALSLTSTAWPKRCGILLELPDVVEGLDVLVGLLEQLIACTSNGNDLYWVREILRSVCSGEIDGPVVGDMTEQAVRAEAGELSEDLFLHAACGDENARRLALEQIELSESMSMQFDRIQFSRFQITNRVYRLFDPNKPVTPQRNTGTEALKEHPVVGVTWYEAIMFCEWLSAGMSEGQAWRLPTVAEWEALAGRDGEREASSGIGEELLTQVAWHKGNSGSRTHPVGEKAATRLGLFDLFGNVWEWTSDSPFPTNTPLRLRGGERFRAVKGGSFNSAPRECRHSAWASRPEGESAYDLGFRPCLVEVRTEQEHRPE